MSKEFYGIKFTNVEGYWVTSRGEVEDLIDELLEDLRSLHDYTFINVTDANKVEYLRMNIEEGLKKWEAKKNEGKI